MCIRDRFGNDHEPDLWPLVGSDGPFWRFRPMAPFGPDSADGQGRPFGSVELRIRLERRYRAEILSRNDPCNEIRAPVRRYELIIWRCMAIFVPKSAISEMGRCGSTGKRAIGGKNLTAVGRAWAVLGGMQSG